MICHFSSHSKNSYNGVWHNIMMSIAYEMNKRGYVLTKDGDLNWNGPEFGDGLGRTPDIVIYTNCNHYVTPQKGWYVGLQGPAPGYFSIDKVGCWPHLESTYTPKLSAPIPKYPEKLVYDIKQQKLNHYNNKHLNRSEEITNVPKDHVLLIMSASDQSWTPTWTRFATICNMLLANDHKIVVKFTPEIALDNKGERDTRKIEQLEHLFKQFEGNLTCYYKHESLHDILPHSKAVIVEDNIQNLEPFMYDVPVITLGAPPYRHWVKQIYHAHEIVPAVENLSWFNEDRQRDWFSWYVNDYLCSDMESVARRIDQLL